MENPNFFGSEMDEHYDLVGYIAKRLQQNKIDYQILEVLQQAISHELDSKKIVLTGQEKLRLLDQATRLVMEKILIDITEGK